jgi:putative DNA primase/helicase
MDLVSTERFLHPEQWDVNLNLLVCKNGTLDLKTLELQEHAPENYATAAVEYEYDPEADCPTFRRVVSTTMSHAADFLQEFAGYCLTTDTSLETAVWLKGDPGGGKSTFLEGLQVMLGERCGTLGIANIERSRFGLAGIIGKTLLIASDQPGGYITASNILNNLISGERVPVERKHKDVVDVTPRAKICWSMNSLPNVKGGGNSGLFRRVEVVECETVPEGKRDPAVKEQVKKEAAGILNWAIEGLQRLRERGRFDPPTSVTKATKKFQERNDKPALFLKARLIRGPERKVKASELYKAYKVWCDENGYKSEARQKLSDDWKRLGLERKKRRSGYYYFGAGLLDQHKR